MCRLGKQCNFVLLSSIRNSIINDSRPCFVAIADFNNDGLLDIVVPNSGMNNIGIFLRHINGTFADQITYSTGSDSTPYAVAVTDFNHDRRLDIAVANFGSHSVGIFLGIGNGTFKLQTTFSTGSSRPRSIAVGDFNNDKELDIVVVNYGTNNVGVFLQDTNGSFANQTTFSTDYDSNSYSLAVGDINNDNKLDIVVANYGTNNVGVFLGHGNGTFQIQIIFTTGVNSHPYSIAIGNLNNDTYLDIVVACSGTNNVGVLLGYGDGSFAMPTMYSTGNNSSPYSVAIADLDNDNNYDIAVANYGTGSVVILLGDGNGYFSDYNQIFYNSSNFNPYSVAIGDFNLDNRSDIAVVNYNFNYVDAILNYRNYSFHSQTTYPTYNDFYPASVVVADLNNDNHLDIIITDSGNDSLGIFLGCGNGTFQGGRFYSTGSGSGSYSVAVGDFNNDNQLDIVVANNGINNIGVFLGSGDGTFSSQITFSTGNNSQPYAVTAGDFNNDDRLDIAVANNGTNNVGIFLGYGNGTFASQVTHSTDSGMYLSSIAVGDFNNDNQLDVVITTYNAYTGGNLYVFLGYGNGTFSVKTIPTEGISSRYDAVVGDLNNDGELDIIVAAQDYFSVIVFLGYGNGTFSSPSFYLTGSQSHPYACALGDVNNDNRLDVVIVDVFNNNFAVLFGDGHGSFFNERSYSTGNDSDPLSVAFGDFNDDRILDIVVANHNTNTIGVFLGYTYISGVREATCSTGSSPNPRAIALADFNKDTKLDIVMANYGLDNVEVFLEGTNSTFPMQIMFSTGVLSLPTSVAVGDFNNDSELDITVANSGTENIGVLYGYGNGSFTNQTTLSIGLNSVAQSVAVGDFNNDKKLDIVVADSGTDRVLILLRYDPGALGNKIMYPTGVHSYPYSVAVGDLNNDGCLDFAVINDGTATVGVVLGLGNGTFSNQTIYSLGWYSAPSCIVVADLNNDSHLDIIVCNWGNNSISIFIGFGDGTFSNETIHPTGENSQPQSIAIGDLNNDSRLDIVVANYGNSNISILLGHGNGTFSNVIPYPTGSGSYPMSVAVGDFNNDNQLDIVVANAGTNNLYVFIGDGNGTFPFMTICPTGDNSEPASVVIGDFNNDGRLDIAVANSGADNIGVLLGNGNGTFSSPKSYSTGSGSFPYSIAIGDLNNDNQLDIVVANQGSNSFSVLLGFVNGTFFSPSNYLTGDGSQPLSIAVGDFNNDSRLDIIVANSGTGNAGIHLGYISENFLLAPPYQTGLLSRPTSIAVGDFDNDTQLDAVVANNGTNNVMILFGSGYGTFTSHATYSTGNNSGPCGVAVGDFNNDSRLDIVVANPGKNCIGIFLNNGTGTFARQVTHSTDRDSQPYSVAVLDFNNDTRLDIAVANCGSNSVIVFFGDGNGNFTNRSTFNTGFESHPFALAVGDINKDNLTDIIATNNGYGNIDILFMEC
jgi:hypothetical protein